jgi:hypothetical protein
LVVIIVFGLVCSNVATLLSSAVLLTGANVLEWSLGHLLPDAIGTQVSNATPAAQYRKLQRSHQALNEEHAELKRVSVYRSNAVRTVSKRIAVRAAANAAKNVGGVFAEAVPYVGIGAIIAITASDLYDDCQTLKDLNEVNVAFGHETEDDSKVCGIKMPSLNDVRAVVF